jgi:hypothetical protein
MPHCPRCGKRFRVRESVIRHLNQPRSSCANLVDDLVTISQQLPVFKRPRISPRVDQTEGCIIYDDLSPFHVSETAYDVGAETVPLGEQPPTEMSEPVREEFLGAAKAWGSGPTFMDKFDLDHHSAERQDNLYYPFASRQDWQMASFLLRSGLSMAKIDDFLSLELVGLILFLPVMLDNFGTFFLGSTATTVISDSQRVERKSGVASFRPQVASKTMEDNTPHENSSPVILPGSNRMSSISIQFATLGQQHGPCSLSLI